MGSDGTNGDGSGRDGSNGNGSNENGSALTLVDRWIALDRGWQALCLGIGIVAVHLIWQAF